MKKYKNIINYMGYLMDSREKITFNMLIVDVVMNKSDYIEVNNSTKDIVYIQH